MEDGDNELDYYKVQLKLATDIINVRDAFVCMYVCMHAVILNAHIHTHTHTGREEVQWCTEE